MVRFKYTVINEKHMLVKKTKYYQKYQVEPFILNIILYSLSSAGKY